MTISCRSINVRNTRDMDFTTHIVTTHQVFAHRNEDQFCMLPTGPFAMSRQSSPSLVESTAAAGAALTSNSHLGSTLSNIAKTPTTMISSALGPSATAQRSNCCNSGNSEDFPVLTKNYSEALWLLQTPPPPCTTCRLTWYC